MNFQALRALKGKPCVKCGRYESDHSNKQEYTKDVDGRMKHLWMWVGGGKGSVVENGKEICSEYVGN